MTANPSRIEAECAAVRRAVAELADLLARRRRARLEVAEDRCADCPHRLECHEEKQETKALLQPVAGERVTRILRKGGHAGAREARSERMSQDFFNSPPTE